MKKIQIFFALLAAFMNHDTNGQSVRLTNAWELVETENNPIARHENSFVVLGHKLYLLGGRGIKKIAIYNVNTNTWTEGKEPPIEIHHFQGVAYQGKIYVVAAMTGKYPYEKPLSTMWIYDPKKDVWIQGPEIPKARRRGSAGVVVRQDTLYLISGIVDGHNSQHVPWVDA